MTEQNIKGGVDQAVGRLQNAGGALGGDFRAQAAGKARELKGRADLYGDASGAMVKLASRRPLSAVGAALGIGMIIGLFLARS